MEINKDKCLISEYNILVSVKQLGKDNTICIDYNKNNFVNITTSKVDIPFSDEYDYIVDNFSAILMSNKHKKSIMSLQLKEDIKVVDELGIDYYFKFLFKRVTVCFTVTITNDGLIGITLEPGRYDNAFNSVVNNIKDIDGLVGNNDYIKQLTDLITVMSTIVIESKPDEK